MRFLDPWWLLSLIAVIALAVGYVVLAFRRSRVALRFGNLSLLRSVAPRSASWRRHVVSVILLLGLLVLAAGMARPVRKVEVPVERATVVLAIDVSLSMQATDVAPSRLRAAQAAAKQFVSQLPRQYNVALVSFAGAATVAVPPTKDHGMVMGAIDRLQLSESTAIGEAIFAALQAVQEVPSDGSGSPPPAHIVLLSDGSTTVGRSDSEGADAAVARRVPVSTIAFGTPGGTVELDGVMIPVPVDGPALRAIAQQTDGRSYSAGTEGELKRVYQNLGSSLGHRSADRDIMVWFLGIGLVMVLVSAGLSLVWTSRLT